ncbi:DNA-binding response regulator, OmpR family, contains REC and winged-helix (wHTH) domain [Austwickia chelonae]|uniref:Putative two-component response regulator n=1 Tax=Austwickia chelonae NBRC 105200 TaxID=1184607 RepID=K6WC03_9MICO|nr:response regulator transcription factor [Austwickia chelonae]GAB79362.1 putative two-component response regulator [Austwickia chelonae NBRC 105200]SEW43887.1 DNA-binding response regulator, OmpR family, contains REC and winged-helix (wHTH) domain [Austwickia chelonae]
MTQRRQVLIVDDETHIRHLLRPYLETDGFAVDEVSTGLDAVDTARRIHPDVVLLDLGLPDIDGLEVLRRLRTGSDVCVILVSARADEVDKLVGLAVGADDYITKPFSPREVVARVNTVLRRASRALGHPMLIEAGEIRRFTDLIVDCRRREVYAKGREVALSTLQFDLLWTLVEDPGRVFSRAKLLERVWGYDFYGDERVVDVHVRNIRRALGDDAAHPRMIGTVRGVGYKFLLRPQPFTWSGAHSVAGAGIPE